MFVQVLSTYPKELYSVILLCGSLGDLKIGKSVLPRSICDALGIQRNTLTAVHKPLATSIENDAEDPVVIVLPPNQKW